MDGVAQKQEVCPRQKPIVSPLTATCSKTFAYTRISQCNHQKGDGDFLLTGKEKVGKMTDSELPKLAIETVPLSRSPKRIHF
jgi:hypothetical protein